MSPFASGTAASGGAASGARSGALTGTRTQCAMPSTTSAIELRNPTKATIA